MDQYLYIYIIIHSSIYYAISMNNTTYIYISLMFFRLDQIFSSNMSLLDLVLQVPFLTHLYSFDQ